MEKRDIKEFTRDELNRVFVENGFKIFHSQAVFNGLYKNRVEEFSRIPKVSKPLTKFMEERFYISRLEQRHCHASQDGTRKYIFSLPDGNSLECVYIPEPHRKTLCVSSQVGCKYGCTFCVTGRKGLARNLTAAEIVNQVLTVNDQTAPEPVTNVVFMGTGEPLDNYENLTRAIDILLDQQGLYMAKRKISVSTCGVVPGIQRMIEDKQGVRLSVSLHATGDRTRTAIMPVNRKYPLNVLKKSIQSFADASGSPVYLEYTMIRGVNVSKEDAHSLAAFVKDLNCKINLIPYNPSPHFDWQPPEESEVDQFRKVLEEHRVFYWVRKTRGQDISAACGMLPPGFNKEGKTGSQKNEINNFHLGI
ncbi:MAG: 23S rRNA (adenine(2503)-C(2))-methyltransferase RlmN [bacterium]|nr:23S rRNA (adenine(2503)-C(2))-methyltransferase RlmN [bacterium]